ncbi:MAG: HupE/UreJ family protein [Saprospiraceae bacterium]|nr:HupE/UreJ family protein [Candidatus Vicinibacter affinis]MBK6821487.1 HupE/UreJ family protein [Candidatus Vicinibacter affinis]MBK7695865.1 HupE/UreJ family protein [Candidatus Vicinibacter affinis]MBK8643069.1 HupE/UreJ family protein [Candidatus Vicinibacter affinis]MBK9959803.1 HupE/UreJ family protein [Candidatus Vicinibacter affinis]
MMGLFLDYGKLGFEHVVPLGYDHILFIISMFFLNSKLKYSIIQCSVFTIAHSITLFMATLGYVHINSKLVETTIALSIFILAFENLLHTDLKSWRLLVVFLFGLIHGLGFASILEFIEIPESDLITALFGFNCGVELAQIIVVVICYFVFAKWFSQKDWYRKYLVIPLSIMISGIGLLWTYERLFSA